MTQPPEQVDLLVRDALVITMDGARAVYRNGFVAAREGRIVAVGPASACRYAGTEEIGGRSRIVLPGLVNAHDHLAQSIFRGTLDELPPSAARRGGLFHLSRALTPERAAAAARVTLLELTRYGVTTTHDSHFTHAHRESIDGVCHAIVESKVRAVVARAVNDTAALPEVYRETAEQALAELDRLRATWSSPTLTLIPEAVGTLRNTPETIQAMYADAVAHDSLWHMHLAQNVGELEATLSTFGCGTVELLSALDVLDERLLAAHCVGLLPHEVALLGAAGARIAHCPLANLYRGSEVAPIMALRAAGALVALGVDGAGTNNGQNPWETMKVAIYEQKRLARSYAVGCAELALEMATIDAARALGVEDRVGSLEPGKDADLLVIDATDPSLLPADALPSHLAYALDPRAIERVVMRGETVWADGAHRFLDAERIVHDAERARREMIAELGDPYPRRSPWTFVA